MTGLTKEDSTRIGFAVSCLFAEALTFDELHQWILNLYESEAEIPPYMVDLLEFKGPLFKISKVIGFVPVWTGSEDEELALFGITYKRGREPFQCPLTRDEALAKLKQYPGVQKSFRSIFPFITLDD